MFPLFAKFTVFDVVLSIFPSLLSAVNDSSGVRSGYDYILLPLLFSPPTRTEPGTRRTTVIWRVLQIF